jgi:hypothetical protein
MISSSRSSAGGLVAVDAMVVANRTIVVVDVRVVARRLRTDKDERSHVVPSGTSALRVEEL